MKSFNKKILISSFILLTIYISIIALFTIIKSKNNEKIKKEISTLEKKIEEETKNQKIIELYKRDFLKNGYFNKENIFENYIRDLLNKYKIKLAIYHSRLIEKNFSELDISFYAEARTFFIFLNTIENGEKVITVKYLSINKEKFPMLKVNIKLTGYYKNEN